MTSAGPQGEALTAEPGVLRTLAARLLGSAAARPGRRWLLGIGGLPGAGKSTLATQLLDHLHALSVDNSAPAAVLVPMDGFHFTNDQLRQSGLRDRKGAPQTFDAQAYIAFLAQAANPSFAGPFPIYDRTVHEPVWRDLPGQRITLTTRIIVTEGNYLLLDEAPWSRLAEVLDETWWLETPAAIARRWLVARHIRGGRTPDDAEAHVCRSDDANALLVMSRSRPATFRLRWPRNVVGQES